MKAHLLKSFAVSVSFILYSDIVAAQVTGLRQNLEHRKAVADMLSGQLKTDVIYWIPVDDSSHDDALAPLVESASNSRMSGQMSSRTSNQTNSKTSNRTKSNITVGSKGIRVL